MFSLLWIAVSHRTCIYYYIRQMHDRYLAYRESLILIKSDLYQWDRSYVKLRSIRKCFDLFILNPGHVQLRKKKPPEHTTQRQQSTVDLTPLPTSTSAVIQTYRQQRNPTPPQVQNHQTIKLRRMITILRKQRLSPNRLRRQKLFNLAGAFPTTSRRISSVRIPASWRRRKTLSSVVLILS